jgi:hypothetical protein
MEESQLLKLKEKLALGMLAIPGVSGIGIGIEGLNVYMEKDDETIRAQVERQIRSSDAHVPIRFVISGPFKARDGIRSER